MRYYMAPLEEVTGYVFRNAYHAHFYPFDKYFAPFVAAKEQKGDFLITKNEMISCRRITGE